MTENWKIQVSPKLTDGTLINLRAETAEEAERILAWATANAGLVTSTVAAFGATTTVTAAIPGSQVIHQEQSPWSQPQQAAPQFAQPAAAAPAGRSCVHGQMVYRTGSGAKGPWRAFFCPTAKGTPGQCEAQFVRD